MCAERGISQHYAFTITLKPRMFVNDASKQYDQSTEQLCHLLSKVCYKYTAVAELTKAYNIHFHGMCNFRLEGKAKINCCKYFVDAFRNHPMFGFVNIKPVETHQGWVDYIKKDLKSTNDSIGQRPILHDGCSIMPTGMFELYGIVEN